MRSEIFMYKNIMSGQSCWKTMGFSGGNDVTKGDREPTNN